MDLVRDLLDELVVDRNGRELGRVDSVVITVRPGAPPCVDRLEIGARVLFARVHPWLAAAAARLERAFGAGGERPIRIPFANFAAAGARIKLDLAVGETAAGTIEARLRRWLRVIPGGS